MNNALQFERLKRSRSCTTILREVRSSWPYTFMR